jgi:hypothetical protein
MWLQEQPIGRCRNGLPRLALAGAAMNYLAHALDCLDCPYEVAGRAVPDWLCLSRPRLRCRSRHAKAHVDSPCHATAAVARGVARHHADDDWFHHTPAFGDLSLELARRIRAATGDADGMRPGFLGHILLEMLLDAAIAASDPTVVERYYAALAAAKPRVVARAVSRMIDGDAVQLEHIITRFVELEFLYDYAHDELLLYRLNQVMRRVRLPELPPRVVDILPAARLLIAESRESLLSPTGRARPRRAAAAC